MSREHQPNRPMESHDEWHARVEAWKAAGNSMDTFPSWPEDTTCTGCGQAYPCAQERRNMKRRERSDLQRIAGAVWGPFAPLVAPRLFK